MKDGKPLQSTHTIPPQAPLPPQFDGVASATHQHPQKPTLTQFLRKAERIRSAKEREQKNPGPRLPARIVRIGGLVAKVATFRSPQLTRSQIITEPNVERRKCFKVLRADRRNKMVGNGLYDVSVGWKNVK